MPYSFTGKIHSNTNTILAVICFSNRTLQYSDEEWGNLTERQRQNLKYNFVGQEAKKYDYDYFTVT